MTVQEFYTHYYKNSIFVTTDSRSVAPRSIFFALKGDSFDGNTFALQALQNGAMCAVVDNAELQHEPNCVCVPNVLQFMQELAQYHRRQFAAKVIAITGTNGKTTTKELVAAVLSKSYKVYATQGNLNNHIGVPLTLLSIPIDADFAIVEMGANHRYEIEFLCKIAEPDYGLITNIGIAHIEGFGSYEQIISTKTELYRFVSSRGGTIFQDADNSVLIEHTPKGVSVFSYGFSAAQVMGAPIESTDIASFILTIADKSLTVNSQLFGNYNSKNMLAAAAVGSYFSISLPIIVEALESYKPSNNRSQILKTSKNTLILDMYNANPSSMNVALEQFMHYNNKKLCVILGQMNELGEKATEEHAKIVNRVEKSSIDKVFYVGNWTVATSSRAIIFKSTEQLYEYINTMGLEGYTILLKGSRGVQLEKLLPIL